MYNIFYDDYFERFSIKKLIVFSLTNYRQYNTFCNLWVYLFIDFIETMIFLSNSVEQIEGMMDSVFVPLMFSEDSHKGEKMMENLHKLASILQITAGNERVSY